MDSLFSFKVPADISNYPQYQAVYRKLYVKALVIIGMPVSAFFCLYNFYQSRMVMGGIVFVMFLALCFFVYDFKMKPEGRTTGFFQELAIRVFLIFFILFLLYDADIDQSISKTPWFLIFSVLIFFSINMREALAWSACIAAILAYFFFVSDLRANPNDIFQLKTRLFLIYGMLASIAFVTSGVMQSALQNLFNNQKELQEANQRLLDENEERKKVEEALRRSEEKFRSFVESTSDWIWEVNVDGVYTYSSPQVEGILGYKPEEIVGKTPFDIMQPEEADRAAGVFKTAVKQSAPIVSLDNECVHKDGRIITLETSSVPVLDKAGNVACFRGIDRDISDRRKTEEALQASNERFLTVLNSIDATIYVSDMDTYEILFTNKNMIETFGRDTTGEVCYDVFRKLSEPCGHCPMDQLIDENGTPAGVCVWQAENPVVKKWYINYDRAIEWTDGRLVKLQIAADITHLKRIEKQLQIAQQFEAIGTLAGGIAHQFNNSLAVITGNISLLEMNFPENKYVATYADRMIAAAMKMAQLTAQLLAYARGGKYKAEIVSMADLIEQSLPVVKHDIHPDTAIDVHLPPDMFNVKVDPIQMQMVLAAVLNNAAEAMDKNETIRLSCQNVAIGGGQTREHPDLNPGDYVRLMIIDSGKGMDEETLDRIFEPFFTTKFEGRGLGLASAYGIVKNHGGGISVDSEPGKGTTVKIYLPATESQVPTDAANERSAERPAATGTILLIEDEEMVSSVCREMLERMGYRVLEAQTGHAAIDIVKTFDETIDLALLDINLPDMKGSAVYPFLMESRPGLKVVVTSGYSIDGPVQEILDTGAEGFIQKPFTIEKLIEKMAVILKGSQ